MTGKTATLIGATGLIGGELLNLLLEDSYFQKVRILIRRPFDMDHPRLEKKLVDFNDADSLLVALDGSDVIFVAIGTTQKKVKGNKEAYRKIDFDIPLNIARYAKMVGCKIFVMVSSIGANSASSNFYIKLKGETEEAVKKIGIESLHIMRPSMLLGNRREFRLAEKIVSPMMKIFSFVIPSKFKAIQARDVAKAMLAASKKNEKGVFLYDYEKMKKV